MRVKRRFLTKNTHFQKKTILESIFIKKKKEQLNQSSFLQYNHICCNLQEEIYRCSQCDTYITNMLSSSITRWDLSAGDGSV